MLGRVLLGRVPRRRCSYEDTTTPSRCVATVVSLVATGPDIRLSVRSHAPPGGKERRRGTICMGSPISHCCIGRERASHVPRKSTHALAAFSDPGQADTPVTWGGRFCPRLHNGEDHDIGTFEAQSRGFGISCLRFMPALRRTMQDSLPAGRQPVPGGSGYPPDFIGRFQVLHSFPLPWARMAQCVVTNNQAFTRGYFSRTSFSHRPGRSPSVDRAPRQGRPAGHAWIAAYRRWRKRREPFQEQLPRIPR